MLYTRDAVVVEETGLTYLLRATQAEFPFIKCNVFASGILPIASHFK